MTQDPYRPKPYRTLLQQFLDPHDLRHTTFGARYTLTLDSEKAEIILAHLQHVPKKDWRTERLLNEVEAALLSEAAHPGPRNIVLENLDNTDVLQLKRIVLISRHSLAETQYGP